VRSRRAASRRLSTFAPGAALARARHEGMSRIGWLHFAALNAIGAAVWSACWIGAGYVAGTAVEAALGNLKHADRVVAHSRHGMGHGGGQISRDRTDRAAHADEQQLLHRMGQTPMGCASGHPEPPHVICGSPEAAAASAGSLSVGSSAPSFACRPRGRGRGVRHHANASSRGHVRMHAGSWSGHYSAAQFRYWDPCQQGTAPQSPFRMLRRRPGTPAMCLIPSSVETLENHRSLRSGSHRAA
jgi:hypothetical protein